MIVSSKGSIRLVGDNNVILSELLGILLAFSQNAQTDPKEVLEMLEDGVDTMTLEQVPADEMKIILPDKTLVDGHGNAVATEAEKLAEKITEGVLANGEDEDRKGQTGETSKSARKKSVEGLFRQRPTKRL